MRRPTKAQVEAGLQKVLGYHEWICGSPHLGAVEAGFKAGWAMAFETEHEADVGYVGREIFKESPNLRAKIVARVKGHLVVRYPGCMLFLISDRDFKEQWKFFE